MKNGLDYMPITEVHEHLNGIKLSIDKLGLSVAHHEKMLENMHDILQQQAINNAKITEAIDRVSLMQADFREQQKENEKRFNRLTIRLFLVGGLILFVANEVNVDLSGLLGFL